MNLEIIKHPPYKRPITIIASVSPDRQKQLEQEIVMPFFRQDPLFAWVVAYWQVMSVETGNGYDSITAYNNAAQETESEILIFSTSDIYIPKAVFWNGYLGLLETGRPILALRFDQQEGGSWEENNDSIGDYFIVRKEWAEEVGFWDQRMQSWGYQDYDFMLRLKDAGHEALILGDQPRDRVLHRWHPRRDDTWYRAQNETNQRIVKEHGPWTKEMYLEAKEEMANEETGCPI